MADRVGPFEDPDRYELVALRSRGGEGELWQGTIAVGGQELPVAVKIVHSGSATELAASSERWRSQAELLRSLEHPSLVKVREVFEGPVPHAPGAGDPESGSLYLVMNWAQGESLPEWVAHNPDRDVLASTRIVSRVASAVDYLHSGKATSGVPVLHRDIKPANVVVDGGDVRLVDFGFARFADSDQMTIVGTPAYLAPEVIAGASSSVASDLYGLGATAFYLFTGSDPDLNDYPAMRAKLLAVPGMEGREDFADHVLSMMARDPAQRPTHPLEWSQMLAVGAVSERFPVTAIGGRGTTPAAVTATGSGTDELPRRRRRAVVIGAAAAILVIGGVAVALVSLGGGGSSSSTASKSARKSAASGSESTASSASRIVTIEDLTGMTLADAKAKLRKDGIADVTTTEQESSKPEGTVIAQDPTAGSNVSGTVTLTIAKAAKSVPDVTGKLLSDAMNELQGIGLTVTSTDVLDDTKTDGTVIGQDPAAGSSLGTAVTLKVARKAVGTFIADLTPVEGGVATETANVSGQAYAHSVLLETCSDCTQGVSAGYDLGRHYQRLKGTLGLRDDAPSSVNVKFEILADGRSLLAQTIALGQAVPVDVDVTGTLRLTLSVTVVNPSGSSNVYAVFGDLETLGAASEVPGYATSSTTTTTGP